MIETAKARLSEATGDHLLLDSILTYTGDDLALITSHLRAAGDAAIHRFAWECFLAATDQAREAGLYGSGQDLLVSAPSGNVRGAGPAVAEIEFVRDTDSKDRAAEAFLVFAADKCGPGAYNYPLYATFCDPMHNGGLLLSPKLHKGFIFSIIDMDYKGKDSDCIIRLNVPEHTWDVACLLQNHRPVCSRSDSFALSTRGADRLCIRHSSAQHRRQVHGQG
jgi:fructose 1,6-bisphosphate aldolase/phosphatase